jgi:hypothetical protein
MYLLYIDRGEIVNIKDFEKLVRPYLYYTKEGEILIPTHVNHSLIQKQFEIQPSPSSGHIIEENKLIYIPKSKQKGYLVFSDETSMYCWAGGIGKLDEWFYAKGEGWSNTHHWVHREIPISRMNEGGGWSLTPMKDSPYLTLELPLQIDYINWPLRNPIEVKE